VSTIYEKLREFMHKPKNIAAPQGKLGILLPGMGAVATTFMAGVELVRKKKAQPVGSLTQMATIRLGKRTEGRSPRIKDLVPLARLEDLVFGGWDIMTLPRKLECSTITISPK
jgi:myo-inositol-1-phosphate synthase